MIKAHTKPPSKAFRLGALLLLLATWALLLFRLNEVPPGFQHDQMFNSLDALSIGRGRPAFPLYFPANFGREALGIYPVALIFKLAGGHFVWSLRFTSVLWGMAALSLTVVLALRYMSRAGALVAGALLAGSFWFIFTTRLGLEPALLIALATGTIYFLSRGLANHTWRDFAAAGLFGGLAVHTYLASRGLFVLLALLLGYELLGWLIHRLRNKEPRLSLRQTAVPGLLVAALVMAAISAPLFIYLQTRPDTGDLRVGELGGALSAVLAGDLRPLLANVRETMLAVLWSGPASLPYHYNVPGRPVLQPLLALFFLVGLVLTLLRLRRATEFLLLAALFVGLLPDFATGADALHMRGVIALPLIFLLTARGLWESGRFVVDKLAQRGNDPARSRAAWSRLAAVLVLLLLVWHAVDSSVAYFVDWAQAEPAQRIYNADFRAVAAYLDEHKTDEPVYAGTDRLVDLDQRVYKLYESRRQDLVWFSAQDEPPIPATGHALYFVPASVKDLPPAFALLVNASTERFVLPGPTGSYDLVQAVRLSAEDVDATLREANAQSVSPAPIYGEALRLDAAGARQEDAAVNLITRWTVAGSWPHATPPGQPRQPIKLSAALVDTTGYKWAQVDTDSHLPFAFWRPEDSYLSLARLPLPADLPPGDYTVRLALYDDVGGAVAVRRGDAPSAADAAVATISVATPVAGEIPLPPYEVQQTVGNDPLRLLGQWEPVDFLVAGVPTDLHLSWLATQPFTTEDLHFRLQAKASDGTVFWTRNADPLSPPPADWPAGQSYRLTHPLQPEALPASVESAVLELCATKGETELACGIIGQPKIADQPPVIELAAPPQHPSGATWDNRLTLAGYDLTQDDERIVLSLTWLVQAAPDRPLKRFVHAAGPQGQIVAQADATPANGAIPMPYWRAGEYVVDRVELPVGARAGVTALCVGWYQPENGDRLPVRLPNGETPADRQICLPVD